MMYNENFWDKGMVLFTLQTWFIIASLLVAVLVVVESMMLMKNEGKMPKHSGFAIISLITTSWTVVSCLALYFLDFARIGIAVPVMYPLYSLLGFLYSAKLMRKDDLPDDPMDLVVPAKYLQFCQSFGLVYALLCIVALVEQMGYLAI